MSWTTVGRGWFGERVAVRESALGPLGTIPLEYAAVIEPLAVVRHTVKESAITDWSGNNVLVLGGGPIVFAPLLDFRAHGALHAIVSEPARIRREQVGEIAQAVIDLMKEEVAEKCNELTK